MNKKLLIGILPVLMAFALPSLFLREKGTADHSVGGSLKQLVSQKLAAVSKKLQDEGESDIQDINPALKEELAQADEQTVTQAMLDQAFKEHGLAPALVYAFHGKSELFLSEIDSMGALELEGMKDRFGAGVLHWSVMGNCLECVQAGLKKGLNVNSQNSRGETPLVFAISDGDFKMAHYLISVGADPNVVANNVGYTLLMSASFEGLDDLAGLIISANGNILAADLEGKTAIHYAAKEGHSQVVRVLLSTMKKRGLDLTSVLAKRDSLGKSALDYANEYGHKKVEQVLLNL